MGKESFGAGVLFMLLSAVGLAFTGSLGKVGLESFSLSSLIFWRFFCSLLLCLALFWMTGRLKHGLRFGNVKLHFLRAFFILSSQYGFYYYIAHNSVLNGIVLINMGPMFIPLIEWIVLHRRVGKSSWIGTFVAFLGMVFVLQPDRQIFSLMSAIGLFAGLSQGASQVVSGINSQIEKSEHQVLYLLALCTIFSAFPYLFSSPQLPVTGKADLLLLFLAIASVANILSRAAAYRHGTPSRLAPFLYVSILAAGFFDWVQFGAVPNALSFFGAALIVLGGVLKIYLRSKLLQRKKP